jgi:membrane-associated phospholipid phosphatase
MLEPESMNSSQKRSLQRLIYQFVSSTVIFWLPVLIFLALANSVREKEPIFGDVAILQALHVLSAPWLDTFFTVITMLGSAPVVITAVVIAAATMFYLGKRRNAVFLIFAAGGTAVIDTVFKLLFQRQRPDLWQHLVVENGYSFPSGHAMISSTLALAVILMARQTKYRWYAVIAGSVYALLVGLSRLYLGVHFPSDVLAGWCVSILWIVTLYRVMSHYGRPQIDTPES